MDENNKPQSDFDLDAALAEKFQQVQQDANRLRAMNDNTDTPASSPFRNRLRCRRNSRNRPLPEPESPEEPAEELPQFDIETPQTGCYHRGGQSRSQRAKSPLQAETAAPDHQPHRCRCGSSP
ncbi:MAG: hypothetical protein ACLSFT_03825 [Ruminococcus callidus]